MIGVEPYLFTHQRLSFRSLRVSERKAVPGILTAAHDATRPSISIPASARAVLAATVPVATQESIPSFSMIVKKTSIVDLGNSSRRMLETRDWWIRTAIERSSAS